MLRTVFVVQGSYGFKKQCLIMACDKNSSSTNEISECIET